MKKYKLIKEYPGSPKLGEIVKGYGRDGWYSKGEGHSTYDWRQVVNYPEYWEEVIEKDYEILTSRVVPYTILSVKRLSDGEIFMVGDSVEGGTILAIRIDKFYTGGVAFSLNTSRVESLISIEKVIEKDYEIVSYVAKDNPNNITTKRRGAHLHEEYWKINSVKRLSDGEIFTLGDRVKGYEHGCIKTITEIVVNDTESILTEGIWLRYDSGSSHMAHAIKVKNPIFLTHDGEDIFDGDKVWYVNKQDFYKSYFIASKTQSFFSDRMAYFLTREEAEDYIERNKVLFTTEDGVGIKKGDMIHGVYRTTNTISNTVVGCNRGLHDTFEVIFSTRAAAENYLVQKSHSLSIEDFWEITCMSTSNFNKNTYMKDLVKERLGL
jgi:hypothetical protein